MSDSPPTIQSSLSNSGARVVWIEELRVIACVAVVFIHVSGLAYERFLEAPWWEWWLANVMTGSSRASVPVFMMISGALMREKDCDVLLFYRKKVLRFIPVILAWTIFYGAFDLIVMGHSFKGVILEFVSYGYTYQHLWYLSMLGCMFAFAPYLLRFKFPVSCSQSEWRILVSLGVAFLFIEWGCHFASRALGGVFHEWTRTFVAFIPYFLLGAWFSEPAITKKRSRYGLILGMALVLSWGANYLSCKFLGMIDDAMPLSSQSPMVLVVAVALFLTVRSRAGAFAKPAVWLSNLGEASLGIYLVHPFFIWFFRRILRGSGVDLLVGWWILPTALAAFAVSFGFVLLLRKFQLGRKFC